MIDGPFVIGREDLEEHVHHRRVRLVLRRVVDVT
jgi:hypothetical protein